MKKWHTRKLLNIASCLRLLISSPLACSRCQAYTMKVRVIQHCQKGHYILLIAVCQISSMLIPSQVFPRAYVLASQLRRWQTQNEKDHSRSVSPFHRFTDRPQQVSAALFRRVGALRQAQHDQYGRKGENRLPAQPTIPLPKKGRVIVCDRPVRPYVRFGDADQEC